MMEAHGDAIVKRARAPALADGVADDVLAWLLMDDDDGSEDELLNLLDAGNSTAEPARTVGEVRFIDNPYSSLLVFQSSSSYITINGNEETCGSSFSDSGTSVMASVDMNGLNLRRGREANYVKCSTVEKGSRASGSSNDATRQAGSGFGDGRVAGCDLFDWDCEWNDEVLARFLGEEDLFSEKNH